MPKYKLVYFNLKARAEDTRLLFAAAGVEYEDRRIHYSGFPVTGEWVDLQPKFLFHEVPMLEVESGITLYQSHAIARYIATEFGLAGESNLEKAQVDMIVGGVEDVFNGIRDYFFAHEDKQPQIFEGLFDSQSKLSIRMGNLERLLTANNGGDGFFVGNKLTWADLKFHSSIGDNIRRLNPDYLGKYPKLSALMERIEAVPSIKEWVAKRPDTGKCIQVKTVSYLDSRQGKQQSKKYYTPGLHAPMYFLFRKVPMLEVEGVITLYQSHAIARYVANEFGLAGENNLEKAQVDMIVDAVEGGFDKGIKNYFFTAEENKPEVFRRVFDSQSTLSTCMGNLERLLTANNGGDGFFVGNKLTWADLKFHSCLGDSIKRLNPDFLGKYPKLSSLVDRIENVPSIREWMAKRPNTAF
ncbi:uncharacterized protein LOC144446070 [Glandiceps talaboti]